MGHVERPKVTVGFIPLIDCAPLLFAEVLGLYERHGLEVELRVRVGQVSEDQARALVEAAHVVCPYSRATRGNVPVTLTVLG